MRCLTCSGILICTSPYNFDLNHITHFTLNGCKELISGHLEQLAYACYNLQDLNLDSCSKCLRDLQSLKATANQCPKLQGLNVRNIHVSEFKDLFEFWNIVESTKLVYLQVNLCVLRPETQEGEDVLKKRATKTEI